MEVKWEGNIKNRACVKYFEVRYWPLGKEGYTVEKRSAMLPRTKNSYRFRPVLDPELSYEFRVVAVRYSGGQTMAPIYSPPAYIYAKSTNGEAKIVLKVPI